VPSYEIWHLLYVTNYLMVDCDYVELCALSFSLTYLESAQKVAKQLSWKSVLTWILIIFGLVIELNQLLLQYYALMHED